MSIRRALAEWRPSPGDFSHVAAHEAMPDNPSGLPCSTVPRSGPPCSGRSMTRLQPHPAYVPVLITDGKPVEDWVKSVNLDRGEFITDGVGQPWDVPLFPFHSLHDMRYSVYLDIFTRSDDGTERSRTACKQERERELAARTVDTLRIGEMQPERDHS